MNKTTFIQERPDGTHEFVIKYPKYLMEGHQGRELPMMVIPIELKGRSLAFWKEAMAKKRALTFTIMPLRGFQWRVVGVFKELKAGKFATQSDKRIGIDQNAGFITVSCVKGKKILWVRKFKISQKGTSEEHEARIYEVMKEICALARIEQAVVVIEDLNLVDKHKNAKSKRARRHIQRIPYRVLQQILGRLCCREGVTLRTVNPAYTSVLARFALPGMQVHLAAAVMIAWRDIGCDQVELFQLGENRVKIQGEDSPIVVEVVEGMPHIQSNMEDPRFLAGLLRVLQGVNATNGHGYKNRGRDGLNVIGGATVPSHFHGREDKSFGLGPSTVHDQTGPAAGLGPRLRLIVKPQSTPSRAKSKPKTVNYDLNSTSLN